MIPQICYGFSGNEGTPTKQNVPLLVILRVLVAIHCLRYERAR